MAVAVVDIQVNSQGAVSRIRDVNNASRQAQKSIDGLTSTIRNLVGAYAAFNAVKFVFGQAAELESQTRSLQVLTGSVKQAKQIIEELQRLGAVTPFTSTELIDAAKRLNAFGVEAKNVVETTRRLADVSGATGAELQGLVTAYGQVQAKGRLQGEELLQFQERGIALQGELRKMYGLSGEEFQKAFSKGQISAQAVEVAIIRLTEKGGKYANGAIAQSDTLNGKLSTLQDSFQRLAGNIGKFFEPAFKFLIDGINAVIERLNNASRLGAEARAFQKAGQLTKERFGARIANPFDIEVQQYRKNLEKTLVQKELQAASGGGRPAPKAPPTPTKAPPLLAPQTGTGTGKTKTDTSAKQAAEAAAREAERVSEVIRNRLAEGQLLRIKSELQDKISAAEMSGDKMLAARLQGQQRQIDLQVQYAKELANEKDIKAQQAIIFEGQSALVASQREVERELAQIQSTADQERLNALQAAIEKQYQLNTGIQQQLQLADSVSNALGQGLTSAFDALIQGSDNWAKSLQAIASGVLVDIANQLIRIFVIEQAVSAIKAFLTPFSPSTPIGAGGGQVGRFGTLGPNYGIKQFAAGGTPPVGRPSIVGERGPELFMPGVRGTIIPNNAMGGGSTNVVVNVDASGSSVQGDQQQAKQLGLAVSAAVQAELVKQQRPGGLLAGTRR